MQAERTTALSQPTPPRAGSPVSDEELVVLVQAGQTALFEILMRRNNQRLYRAVRGVLRDETEVEDVMQQTYLSAFTHLGQFAHHARFSTWLLRIGVNEALGRLRQRRRELAPPLASSEEDSMAPPRDPLGPTPEDRAASGELARVLEHAIDDLPGPYRAVFMLRIVEGLDTADTAAVLGLGEEAVKQRLHRARSMLQKAIDERMGASALNLFQLHASRCDRVVGAVMEILEDSLSLRP
jgi:RNA polymerase sigma-70 factor, ECF subfamily